jgi:hypothetical protein
MSNRLRGKNGKGDTANVLAGIALFSSPIMYHADHIVEISAILLRNEKTYR